MKKDIFCTAITCAAVLTAQLASSSAYAAVSSDEDSVKEWGPWTTIATAAGGNPTVRLNLQAAPSQNVTDSGQFVTEIPDTTEAYSVLFGALGDVDQLDSSLIPFENGPDDFDSLAAPDAFTENNRVMTSLTTLTSIEGIADLPQDQEFTVAGLGSFTATDEYQNSLTSDQLIFLEENAPFGDLTIAGNSGTLDRVAFLNTAINGLNAGIITAANGSTLTKGTFIGGTASSLGAIQALAGNTSASYEGSFLRSLDSSNVSIRVNFTDSTWSGRFIVDQGVAFGVSSGSISGANLIASNGNLSPNVTNGSVSASFFGDSAEAIAGIADVEIDSTRFADTFVTTKTEDNIR
ncbi:hypothetical protein [Amphritea sp. HPY]|uniref:hypothetical protein n=1 Tax=Amphritea sp. HPY TaxID=3421652 RepID=UPI003D7D32BD